ncbi:MAG: hypothetical protein Greene101449_265 [Candidatus Peregrinibacteria bacterium Greene1014_49]|nr:MAG: hypothetical protein Greene101449_265 [Candidatus Peregrinibacteria bacterium Greene1014_49]
MRNMRLRVAGYGLLVSALSLSIVGCQFSSTMAPVSESETRNSQPETIAAHPLSGLPRRHIFLEDNSGNNITILAEIANEPEAQAQGLMFRENLPQGEGMLFIFPDEAPRGFWMKNTLIPLDILFFDASGTWVSGATMTPCEADPCPGYPSNGAAKYALEVGAGFMAETGVGVGWNIAVGGE